MKSFFESLATTALAPLLFAHGALSQLAEHQREQTQALGALFDSLLGRAVFEDATVTRRPREDEIYPGKTLSRTKTLADAQTACFGWLSLDFNPLHFNEELASRTRFRRRIAHGFHTASLFSGVLAALTPWCVYLHQDLDFTAPVHPADVITATGTVEEIDPRGVIQVSLVCRNQAGEVVVRGRAFVKRLKEVYSPAHDAPG